MPRVALRASEVSQYVSLPNWRRLDIQRRRWVAASIMRKRGDPVSRRVAQMLEIANPNYNDFTVIENA